MLGRPKFKANGVEYLVLPTKATSQNIKFEKDGNTWYVPLVSGTAGSFASENGKNFKLGYLKVGDKYGAVDIGSIPTITVKHQPYHIRNGRIYPINPLVFEINDSNNDRMNVTLGSLEYNGNLNFHNHKTWNNKYNGELTFSGVVCSTGGYSGYSFIYIEIKATNSKNGSSVKTVNGINNNDGKDYTQFENRMYWVDDRTHYTGEYTTIDDTIHITGHVRNNTPYQQYVGFNSNDLGKTVKWDIYDTNGVSVKEQWTANCSRVYDNPVIQELEHRFNDVVTEQDPPNWIGVKICEGWVCNGEFDLVIVVDDSPLKVHDYGMHIIMDDPNNPAGSI